MVNVNAGFFPFVYLGEYRYTNSLQYLFFFYYCLPAGGIDGTNTYPVVETGKIKATRKKSDLVFKQSGLCVFVLRNNDGSVNQGDHLCLSFLKACFCIIAQSLCH